MTKKIIFTTNEGMLAVMHPTEEALNLYTIEEIAEKDVPAGLTYKIVDEAVIPSDRTFRNAWKINASETVEVNLDKAKEITHDVRRKNRDVKFAPLDVKATIPSQAEEAEAARQVIREEDANLQIQIDSATTPEELKTLVPME